MAAGSQRRVTALGVQQLSMSWGAKAKTSIRAAAFRQHRLDHGCGHAGLGDEVPLQLHPAISVACGLPEQGAAGSL